jgi:iron complex transport system permease protein
MSAVVDLSPSDLQARYRRLLWRRWTALALLTVSVGCLLLLDISTGPATFPLSQVVQGLFSPGSLTLEQRIILWDVRIPCALLGVMVGAALGLSGAEMQTVLNNPLASPFTLGLASSASVGASLVVLSGWSLTLWGENLSLILGAFAGSLLATGLLVWLAWRRGASTETVVLFGIALLFTFDALLWLLQYVADSQALQQIVFWTMGSLGRATHAKIAVLGIVFAACASWSARDAWTMTALRGGEEQARSLGLAVERLRILVLLRVSLLSATTLAFVGMIGFVGIVGPHIARLLVGEDHRHYLPAAALSGALMVSGASVLSKSVVPGVVLPIGIVTALIGVPLFFALLLRRRDLP